MLSEVGKVSKFAQEKTTACIALILSTGPLGKMCSAYFSYLLHLL